jgi:hypothetical protein
VKRQTREQWVKLSAEVDRGRSIAEVASRAGVRPKTLVWWRWHLGRRTGPKAAKQPAREVPRLVPVVVRDQAPAPRGHLRLEVGVAVVSFEEDTAPSYVAALARALAAC